jgi:serine/threonine protein kinase
VENNPNIIPFPQMIPERTLKAGSGSSVTVVRELGSGKRFIYRCFIGSPEVYRKLLGVRCRHLPNILDVIQTGDTVHVLEEYIEGDTLAFLLEGCTLSPAIAKQIILELCRALKVLHEIGAVHRDIKPENVMIRGSEAVLIDFDASRLFKENCTTDTRIMGTTGYAAPEQYGFSQTGPRADIYSLGILLNEILTNEHPSRVLAEGKLRPIIEKCTQINADQRYADVSELIAALSGKQPKPIRKLLLTFGSALALTVALGCLLLPTQAPPEEVHQTEPLPTVETVSPTISRITITIQEPPSISDTPWQASTDGYGTYFSYDLDDDGNTENYLFGVDFINSPHENIVYYDINGSRPGETHLRDVHPCVWKVHPDGTLEVATEFTPLLTDVSINVWRVDDLESPSPFITNNATLWPGCLTVIYYPQQDGTWLYEMTACLDGKELTALATTTFWFNGPP